MLPEAIKGSEKGIGFLPESNQAKKIGTLGLWAI